MPDILSMKADSPPLRLALEDTPPETTAMMDTPPEIIPTNLKRKYTRRAPHDQEADTSASSGTTSASAARDKAPEDYEAKAEQLALRGLISDVSGLYTGLGGIVGMVNPLAGSVIVDKAHQRAKELVNALKHNKKALAWLKKWTTRSDVGKAILGHGIMLIAVGVAADRLPLNDQTGSLLFAYGYKNFLEKKIEQLQQRQQQGADNGVAAAAA